MLTRRRLIGMVASACTAVLALPGVASAKVPETLYVITGYWRGDHIDWLPDSSAALAANDYRLAGFDTIQPGGIVRRIYARD